MIVLYDRCGDLMTTSNGSGIMVTIMVPYEPTLR